MMVGRTITVSHPNGPSRLKLGATLLFALLFRFGLGFSLSSTKIASTTPFLGRLAASRQQHGESRLPRNVRMQQSAQPDQTVGTATASPSAKKPGSANLDWGSLGFQFRPTNSFLKIVYKHGEWGAPELVGSDEPYLPIHIGATALHYGQTCFEGLKAFCHANEEVYLFRPDENAKRMQSSCQRIMMPSLPTDVFVEACKMVVRDNIEYVPPYGSNGALYLRPLLFGSGPRIGLQPADEYTFLVLVIPVGDYYAGGLAKTVSALLIEDYDRAAPRGVGGAKVGGNYAADLLPGTLSKKRGFPIGLYLDAATQTKIEEFSTSNFVGIKHSNGDEGSSFKYITPKSPSVLASITNKSLMQIASDMENMVVEERDVRLEELEELDEVLAVGTAVVVTPVDSVTRLDHRAHESDPALESLPVRMRYEFGRQDEIGPVTKQLYDRVRAIQNGEAEDTYGWNFKV